MKNIAHVLKDQIQLGRPHYKAESVLPNKGIAPKSVTGPHYLRTKALPVELWRHVIDLLVKNVLQG
jgi:hypothetical protein